MRILLVLMLLIPASLTHDILITENMKKNLLVANLKPIPKHELKCLVDNAFYEARGEGEIGMLLVTKVVLNRARQNKESYCSTIYKRNQFSWTLMKNLKRIPNDTRKSLEYLVLNVHYDLVDHLVPEHLTNALFYHAGFVKPSWAKNQKKLGTWGNHIFYH
jgi:spore germination cell wall hydrolase CwlJ-like protein